MLGYGFWWNAYPRAEEQNETDDQGRVGALSGGCLKPPQWKGAFDEMVCPFLLLAPEWQFLDQMPWYVSIHEEYK